MTRDGAAKLTIGAYQVAGRLEDRPSGYLVHPVGGSEAVLHALHLVDPADQSLAEAARELERFGQLNDSALPRLVDVFDHDEQLAVVFERADGLRLYRLKGYLDRDRERLPDAAVWQLGWRTMGALAQAHLARDDQGALAPFVHGMLSPRDIVVTWDGEVMVDGLCPFVSSQDGPDQGTESMPAGIWLAPEVRRGDQATAKSDAYSVAIILRSLLTGRPPQAPGVSIRPLAVARPDLPSDVTHALDRALDPAPRLRPSCAELSHRLAGLARMAKGQPALQESMELYQALWGLWSVAAPEVWSQEEPALAPKELPSPSEEQGEDSVPWDSVPARDSTVELEWDDRENAPRTSRSPRHGPAAAPADSSEGDGGDSAADSLPSEEPPPSESGVEVPTFSQPTADGEPVEVDALPSEEGMLGHEPIEPPKPAGDTPTPMAETPPSVPSAPVSDRPPPTSEEPSTPMGTSPATRGWATRGWGRWLAMGMLAVAAAVAAWHTIRTEPTAPAGDGSSPGKAPTSSRGTAAASGSMSGTPSPALDRAGADAAAGLDGAAGPPPGAGASAAGAAPALPPAELLSFQGYLTVRSSVDAEVYVKGVSIGPTNQRNISHCRQKYVRLGVPPGPRWLSQGKTIDIPCRGETMVTIEPNGPQPARR
ncbi:MAG: protein kinase [Deltaproteobacteria bacterium]|nr:protein kinase [Deltaproteobacteria bacterium]